MNTKKPDALTQYKHTAITAATQLCYSPQIIDALRIAKSEGEIARIMIGARKGIKTKDWIKC